MEGEGQKIGGGRASGERRPIFFLIIPKEVTNTGNVICKSAGE